MVTSAERLGVDPHAALLGEVVTWDQGAAEVAYPAILEALDAAGLPRSAAAELRPQAAFSRAVKDLREGRTIDRVKIDSDSGLIHFQFTRKHLDAAELRIGFDFEATCTLDPSTGWIICEDSPQIQEHARLQFAHALAHRNASDVTRMVQGLFKAHADLYPINPKKGVAYFVPEAHREFTARVEMFLRQIGGSLLRFPVPKGTPEGNRAVKESVEEGLKALAAELQDTVDDWDESTRTSTFEKAIERWQAIKHKAEAYSEYLGDRQAALLAALDAQKARLAEKVSALSAAKEEAKEARKDSPGQRTLFPGATLPITATTKT